MAIYQRIGHGYDLTRRADPYITSRLAFHLQIHPDCRYLDVACGTGNYTHALAKTGGAWSGLDQSAAMLCSQRLGGRPLPCIAESTNPKSIWTRPYGPASRPLRRLRRNRKSPPD